VSGKVSPHRLSQNEKDALERELLQTLSAVKNAGMFERFVCELLTPSEVLMTARRILIAKRLLAGQSMEQIRRELSAGQRTIEAVDAWLRRGFREYRQILSAARRRDRPQPYTFRWFRKKYPMHFLLINLMLDGPFPEENIYDKK